MAAAKLEKIEKLVGEGLRNPPRRKRAEIKAAIGENATGDVAARVFTGQNDLEQGRWPKAEEIAVAAREELACLLVKDEILLEERTGQAIADPGSEFAEVEALGESFGSAEEAFEPTAHVGGAHKIGLGLRLMQLDNKDGRA